MNRKFLSILLIVAFAASIVLSVTFLVFELYQKEQEDYIKSKQKYLKSDLRQQELKYQEVNSEPCPSEAKSNNL